MDSLPCNEKDSQVVNEQALSITVITDGDTVTSVDSEKHLSQTVGDAVQQLEDELEIARDSVRANIKSAESQFPKLFYTTSASEAYQVIESYELKTNSKFIVYKESKYFGQNVPLYVMACQEDRRDGSKEKVKHRIVWEDRETSLAKYEPIPYDGVPYMQLGRKICDCHLGVLREKPRRGSSKCNRKIPGSRKVGCTARISLREIHKFPEFKVEKGCDSDYYRSLKSKEIRKAIVNGDIIGERRIYVNLPSVSDHSGHDITRVDNFLTDPKVKKKIYELVYQKIFTVKELREKTKEFVEKELFKGKSLPSLTDTRFHPSDVTFKNICYLARLKMRKEGIPVPVRLQRRRYRKHSLPNVTNVPQVAQEVTVVASADHTTSSPLHSPAPPPLSSSLSETSVEPSDFFDALDEVRSLALKVSDEALLEELRQNVLDIRKRLKAHCEEESSQKRPRLEEDNGELDTWAQGIQAVSEICR
ncbi:Calcium-responsive transcription factor [Holothuria leucospilota]|uniref:Calcium-responsive transcription factor n=1 Tax=Holothuria leucospilota TaxID=206669 RepID=A0A9Q1BGX1_HOLLE|nr:Calcium-responsive transcription factor [Holothuria leucospilota]